jgi:hypothetical protein
MGSAHHSPLGVRFAFSLFLSLCVCMYVCLCPLRLPHSLAELTSGNLCISFPEMNYLFRTRTRHSSRSTPRRATASELTPYKRQKKLGSNDPYMMSTLVGTGTTNSNDGGPYIELEEGKYGARIVSGEKAEKGAEPKNGTIMIDSEISVRTHEAW